eukprot:g62315.t1
MTALDALPAPKHGQFPLPFTDVGEYLHCCELFTVGSKKAYMEVRFRIFCASTAEFSFKLENKEEQTLPLKCMLAEVYEIRGAGAFSDSSTFAGMGEEECPRLIKRLREMWTGGDDYKRKLFTSTINAGKLNKVFHGRLKRTMMAVDISSYAEEESTDSNKVWYWRECVAWEMLPPLETRTDEDQSDQEWEKRYVVEYLRPCLPVEVPTKEDSAGRKVDSSFLADYNVNNSANWRSHKQANVCLDNVLHGPSKRKQTSMPVAEAKSMLGSSNVVPVSSMNVPVDKGQWHIVHFWGNDYTAINSFPAKPPIFYPCFQSLKDYELIFTNVREKKVAYTGKVQDWDFRSATEIFDDGVRQQHNGKRFAQESWDRVLSFAKRYNKMESPDPATPAQTSCSLQSFYATSHRHGPPDRPLVARVSASQSATSSVSVSASQSATSSFADNRSRLRAPAPRRISMLQPTRPIGLDPSLPPGPVSLIDYFITWLPFARTLTF